MSMTPSFAGLLVFAYVLGAIPFGVLVAKPRGVDILKTGSKNIGSTNVARVLGLGPGLLVLVLDVMKGVVPTIIASQALQDPLAGLVVGIAAVMGHSFSFFLRFRGGKGVATALGALLAFNPILAVCALVMFVVTFSIWRYVSLSSMVASLSVCAFAFLFGERWSAVGVLAALGVFIVVRHSGNIRRLLRGEEQRFKPGSRSDGRKSEAAT